jgi:hypothetical protein
MDANQFRFEPASAPIGEVGWLVNLRYAEKPLVESDGPGFLADRHRELYVM